MRHGDRKVNEADPKTSVLKWSCKSNTKCRRSRNVSPPSDENSERAVAIPEAHTKIRFEIIRGHHSPAACESCCSSPILYFSSVAEDDQRTSIQREEARPSKQIRAEQKFEIEKQHSIS